MTLTAKTVRDRLLDRDVQLVGEYLGAKTKTTFECDKDHQWEASPKAVMRGSGCPHCAGKVPLTAEIVNERLTGRDVRLVGEYVSTSKKTTFECDQGHQWEATPNSVLKGTGCLICSGRAQLTTEIVNDRVADRGLRIVTEYITSRTKSTFECGQGHRWEAAPDNVMSGSGCPYCAGLAPLSKNVINERIADRGLTLVGEYINAMTKGTFECDQGHRWEGVPANVMSGSGCPDCAGLAPLTKDIVRERLIGRDIKLIGEVINTNTTTTFECDKGHQWKARPFKVLSGQGCAICIGNSLLSAKIVNERIAHRGLKLIGEYTNNHSKSTFLCDQGHQWDAVPASVLNISGCPSCATTGFNPDKPAEFYYVRVLTTCGDLVYMIGITNLSFEKRYQPGEREGTELIHRQHFESGSNALAYETGLKREFRHMLIPADLKTTLRQKGNTTKTSEIFTIDILGLDK